jgi:hypothetical protein
MSEIFISLIRFGLIIPRGRVPFDIALRFFFKNPASAACFVGCFHELFLVTM